MTEDWHVLKEMMESLGKIFPDSHVIGRWYTTCLISDEQLPPQSTAMAAIDLTSFYWKVWKFGYKVGIVEIKQMASSWWYQ